jgi:hypothetical protein
VRHFVIFLLFASSAFSERSASPVRAALAQTAGVADAGHASLETLAAGIAADRRPAAKSALDSIDRSALSTGEFGELSRAYVLLGFAEEAARAGNGLPPNDPRVASGLSQAASAAANRSEYEHAVRLANEALRLNPRDPVATAVLRLAQGRGRSSAEVSPAPARQVEPPTSQPAAAHAAVTLSEPIKRRPLSDTSMPSLQMLDDETAAPEATLKDRAISLISPSKQLVEQDIRRMRELLVGFELPNDIISLGSTNQEAPRQFVSWIKSVPDSDIAPIAYGILDAGLIGEYSPAVLSKGSITLNHFIRSAERESRATALLHEIYHYWDWKVANNPYPKVVYGFHSPEAIAIREYDAYHVAMYFWKHARPADANSPTARALDRIPSETGELMRQVDMIVLKRQDMR